MVFTALLFTFGLVSVGRLKLRVAVSDCSSVPALVLPGSKSALDTPPMRWVVYSSWRSRLRIRRPDSLQENASLRTATLGDGRRRTKFYCVSAWTPSKGPKLNIVPDVTFSVDD